MERAEADVVLSAFSKGEIFCNDLDNICPLPYLVYFVLRDHHKGLSLNVFIREEFYPSLFASLPTNRFYIIVLIIAIDLSLLVPSCFYLSKVL